MPGASATVLLLTARPVELPGGTRRQAAHLRRVPRRRQHAGRYGAGRYGGGRSPAATGRVVFRFPSRPLSGLPRRAAGGCQNVNGLPPGTAGTPLITSVLRVI